MSQDEISKLKKFSSENTEETSLSGHPRKAENDSASPLREWPGTRRSLINGFLVKCPRPLTGMSAYVRMCKHKVRDFELKCSCKSVGPPIYNSAYESQLGDISMFLLKDYMKRKQNQRKL